MTKKHKKVKKLPFKETSHLIVKEEPGYDSLKPIFSFRHMKYGSDNCLSQCTQDSKSSIVSTLLKLSQFTWNQLASKPKEGLGFEGIPRSRFIVPLPSFVTPDVKKLMVFRYSGLGRIAGIRIHDIYHILVVGGNLYPH